KKLFVLPGHKRTAPIPAEFETYLVIDSAVFSPDGRYLATSSSLHDEFVRVFEVATGKEKYALRRHPHRHFFHYLSFSPEGELVVVSSPEPVGKQQPVITFWDMKTGKIQREIGNPPGWALLAFSPDGRWMAGVGGQGADNVGVAVWDRATGKVRFRSPR